MTPKPCHVCGSTDRVRSSPNCVLHRDNDYCFECILRITESAQDVAQAIAEYGVNRSFYDLTVWHNGQRYSFADWYTQQGIEEQ